MEVHRKGEPRRTPRFSARELNSCVFARTAVTEHHSLGCWSERNVFSHGSVGWKPRIQVLPALVCLRLPSLLTSLLAAFLPCPHLVLSVCIRWLFRLVCPFRTLICLFLAVLGLSWQWSGAALLPQCLASHCGDVPCGAQALRPSALGSWAPAPEQRLSSCGVWA